MISSNDQVLNFSNQMQQIAKNAAEQSAQINEQAALDALWRMEQNNAIAKLKSFSKLAESINSQQ